MLTKQGVWGGALFTLKTLEYTRRALEKHDFNLFQLHASILKKIDVCGCPHFLDMVLLLGLSFSCICDNDLPKAKCTSLWSLCS